MDKHAFVEEILIRHANLVLDSDTATADWLVSEAYQLADAFEEERTERIKQRELEVKQQEAERDKITQLTKPWFVDIIGHNGAEWVARKQISASPDSIASGAFPGNYRGIGRSPDEAINRLKSSLIDAGVKGL